MLIAKHLYLVGYRGSGKSTVARQLALRLGVPWIDADDEVERIAGRSIAAIFADQGETAFRDLETQAIEALSEASPQVIALGGGAVLRSENRQIIGRTGQAVWLDARPEILLSRIESDLTSGTRRPRLTDQSIEREVRGLMRQREPLYREVSRWRVDVSELTLAQVVDAIIEQLASP